MVPQMNAQARPASVRHTPQPYQTGRSVVMAPHGIVATSQPLAAQTGLDIPRKGGNAIDAAIATNAAIGLTEPMSCGIGGDLFAIVWDAKTQKLYGINASGRSPYRATRALYAEKGMKEIPLHGVYSWSVPGCVSGWEELHKKFGKLPMTDILQPSIDYAEKGFPVSENIGRGWAGAAKTIGKYPETAQVYLPGGKGPRPGEIFKNPALARSYREIAAGGANAYYKGRIAKEIVAYSDRNG